MRVTRLRLAGTRGRWGAASFCALAGGGDLATGLLLLARPEAVLALLGVDAPPGSGVFLRWIGVFVASVGAAYLAPWWRSEGPERQARLRFALELTAAFRLAVAGFVAGAVLAAALSEPWLVVGGFDALVAIAQLLLLTTPGALDAV